MDHSIGATFPEKNGKTCSGSDYQYNQSIQGYFLPGRLSLLCTCLIILHYPWKCDAIDLEGNRNILELFQADELYRIIHFVLNLAGHILRYTDPTGPR